MRFAIIGTRGIPANYGGFETFAEELSKRLVQRGHEVTVYCRSHYVDRDLKEHNGVRLVILPTLRHKYLDTVIHSLLSMLHAVPRRFDAALVCNAANSPLIPILEWTGTRVAVNVDGLERNRKKWNALGRVYYSLGEKASLWFASSVVTDARVIRDYYKERYNADTTLIAYGAEVARKPPTNVLDRYGLAFENYVLYLSRLEPENNAVMVIEAFRGVETDHKLVIVGDAPYADEYIQKLRTLSADDERIIFLGAIYGPDKKALEQNAAAYIHATEVGGTHPALIEAMGAGNCCLVYDTPENREVAADAGLYYSDASTLTALLTRALSDNRLVKEYAERAQERVRKNYSWETVTDEYEKLLERLAKL
jgi:glycosyltransferase involved in cell wall biosynthesis